MTENKNKRDKKDLVIIDFDGTLFFNPENDFVYYTPINHVLDAYTFFSEFMFQTNEKILEDFEYIIITGRSETQEGVITHLLELKGYRIDQSFFNQGKRAKDIDEETFMINYWNGKIKLINEIKLSNRYKSITIIDDDDVLCSALEKLGYTIFKAQITKNSSNQTLEVNFSTPQTRSMTELNSILNPHKNQSNSIMETA
ncbi:MAG: hypothetical protein E3J90_07195 [Promethearchaeota archaeon]|nr:MAG: hypothetical protein E3J90_07195 [Candidatus Lokiarchaeota archaeon]